MHRLRIMNVTRSIGGVVVRNSRSCARWGAPSRSVELALVVHLPRKLRPTAQRQVTPLWLHRCARRTSLCRGRGVEGNTS